MNFSNKDSADEKFQEISTITIYLEPSWKHTKTVINIYIMMEDSRY